MGDFTISVERIENKVIGKCEINNELEHLFSLEYPDEAIAMMSLEMIVIPTIEARLNE